MKVIFALIVFLPMIACAQVDSSLAGCDFLKVHYETVTVYLDNSMYRHARPGELVIYSGKNLMTIDGPMKEVGSDQKKSTKGAWVISARKVEISSRLNSGSLRADRFEYDDGTKKGMLTGHVMAVEKGVKKIIGKKAEVDFSNNVYRIEKLWE